MAKNDFGHWKFIDVSDAVQISPNSSVAIAMIRNRIPNRNSGCQSSMTFDNAFWKLEFNDIASNTNVATVPQIKVVFGRIKDVANPKNNPFVHEHIAAICIDRFG